MDDAGTLISVHDFVFLLWNAFSAQAKVEPVEAASQNLLNYGHVKGWLEDWDEHDSGWPVDKRTAARIIHQFMKLELGVAEIADKESYTKAEELRDLYLCRSCANHIAHVYIREIMEAEFVESNGEQILIFNGSRTITPEEAKLIINNTFNSFSALSVI